MKISSIISETTTAGSVATVDSPLFTQSRKGGNLLTGKKTKKKYANSVSESSNKKVDEAKLEEDDLIIVPGQGKRLKPGFIPRDQDRTDHEVEMARSDLFQAAKNAKKVYELISGISEEEGLEGWVQEKIIKANDYLNTIREYLEHKVMTREGVTGAMLGGAAGAVITKNPIGAARGASIGSELEDMFKEADTGAGVIAGGPQYESKVNEKAVSKAKHNRNFLGWSMQHKKAKSQLQKK